MAKYPSRTYRGCNHARWTWSTKPYANGQHRIIGLALEKWRVSIVIKWFGFVIFFFSERGIGHSIRSIAVVSTPMAPDAT